MKYFSVALALIVCAAVASAAPSPSFEEFGFDPIGKINQKIQEFYKKFMCTRDVIEKAVEGTEFQKDFEEFEGIIDSVYEDLAECESLKCKFEVFKYLPQYFVDFFKALTKKNHELAEKIHQQVTEECFETQDMFTFGSTLAPSAVEELQCMTDVLGQVSKENNMEESWSHSQPILQLHIDNLKHCPEVGNKILVTICNVRETVSFFTNFVEYLKLAAQENPKVVQDFITASKLKCVGLTDEVESFGYTEKFECVKNAISKAVEDTDFESDYDQLKKDLEKVGERIEACKAESGILNVTKCVYEEIKLTNGKIAEFLRNLYETNSEAFERAQSYIKKCLV